MTSTTERDRCKLTFWAYKDTPLAVLFDYLNGKSALPQREGKQRATEAMLAFWKPYALRATESSQETLQAAVQNAVGHLLRQVQSICDDFSLRSPLTQKALDLETLATELVNRLQTANLVTVAGSAQCITASAPRSSSNSTSVDADQDFIFVDDEDLLGDLA
jgi:hypothetical protein